MIRYYGETTVKKLREVLADFDDKDIVKILSFGGEWSAAELHIVRNGNKEEVLMEVDG